MALAMASLVVMGVLLVGPCASGAYGQPTGAPPLTVSMVNVTFVNQLTDDLNVTIGAPPLLGSAESTVISPGGTTMLPLNVLAPVLVQDILQFRVNETLYIDKAGGVVGVVGRALAQTGTLKIVVSAGPCASGQDGLKLVDYAAGVETNNAGCRLCVKSDRSRWIFRRRWECGTNCSGKT